MGCFWAPQEAFLKVPGVTAAEVGYSWSGLGRTPANAAPDYDSVCAGNGFTEAVQVTFDPRVVSYEEVLGQFYELHDSTIEFPSGDQQYISAVWPTDEEQEAKAKAELDRRRAEAEAEAVAGGGLGRVRRPLTVVRSCEDAVFFKAEEYHQVGG